MSKNTYHARYTSMNLGKHWERAGEFLAVINSGVQGGETTLIWEQRHL